MPLPVLRCVILILAAAFLTFRVEGQEKFVVKPPQPAAGRPEFVLLPGNSATVRAAAFSADGARLATAGDGAIFVWDLATGQPAAILAGHGDQVTALAFSPDGKRLASAGDDFAVKVWNPVDGREELSLAKHAGRINTLAFSPDGARLASASDDKTVILWDVAGGKAARILTGHAGGVTALAFSPDGKRLATGGADKRVLLWNVADEQEPPKITAQPDVIAALAFSPDGGSLACAAGPLIGGDKRFGKCEVSWWNVATGETKKLPPVGAGLSALAFTPDGAGIVTATTDRALVIWDAARAVEQQVLVGQLPGPDLARSVTWEADGQITIFELKTRRALLRCAGFLDGAWLSATLEGYYAGGKGGDARAGWRFGGAMCSCEQFATRFNKPDMLRRALAGEDMSREPALDGALPPPNIAFVSPTGGMEIADRQVELHIQAAGLRPIARIELTVNGKPCPPSAAKKMTFDKPEQLQLAVKLPYRLPLDETQFLLRAEACDAEGMRSAPAEVTVYLPGAREAAEQLFVLSAGIYNYKSLGTVTGQRFAVQDAEAVARLFTEHQIQPPCTKEAVVRLITGSDFTAANLTAALNDIKKSAGPKDMVIVYLNTQRVRDAGGNLFLATYDINAADLRRTAFDWRVLANLINGLATRQALVLADIGRSAENATARSLDAQLRAFYAGAPDERYAPRADWGHGAFAMTLIEGLRGKADVGEANGIITFGELNDYVSESVAKLSEGSQHPNWPSFSEQLKDMPLTWRSLPRLEAMSAADLRKLLQPGEVTVKSRDNTGRSLLHWATAADRAELVDLLLDNGADVDVADAAGVTPLHIAAASGLRQIAEKLLAHGANMNEPDRQGATPFEMARSYEQDEMMDFFLPAIAADALDENGNTPLHLAVFYARAKVVRQMLARGDDIEAVNQDGHTPLHVAAASGQVEIAGLLLDKGASLRAADAAAGATPLHLAVAGNQAKMATYLLGRGADANAKDKNERTPLFATLETGNLAMIDLLAAHGARLDFKDKDGLTMLHLAVTGGKPAMARQLLKSGADPNVRDNFQYAPLHWAATQESPEMLKLLLEFKPSLNPHDKDGLTPLHAAAWYNRVENINLLLAAGALLNDKSQDGSTPLALAIKNNAKEAAELLKAKGGFE